MFKMRTHNLFPNNKNSFFIKKKFLKNFLGNEFDLLWIGIGEKRHIQKDNGSCQFWNDLSSLAFYDKDGVLQEINNSKLES